jgi:hypothetical protein
LRLVACAVAVLLGLRGLVVASSYGAGSHYQGGIALFLFMIIVLFWQVSSMRFDRVDHES